ncbi:MAG: hypothetical protein KIT58_06485 [Planctomycetota bacterium]|nr:hypothetical protein [Planctomycetota bacterium]
MRGSPVAPLSPVAAGAEVDVGYDLGHDPIVSELPPAWAHRRHGRHGRARHRRRT